MTQCPIQEVKNTIEAKSVRLYRRKKNSVIPFSKNVIQIQNGFITYGNSKKSTKMEVMAAEHEESFIEENSESPVRRPRLMKKNSIGTSEDNRDMGTQVIEVNEDGE